MGLMPQITKKKKRKHAEEDVQQTSVDTNQNGKIKTYHHTLNQTFGVNPCVREG